MSHGIPLPNSILTLECFPAYNELKYSWLKLEKAVYIKIISDTHTRPNA